MSSIVNPTIQQNRLSEVDQSEHWRWNNAISSVPDPEMIDDPSVWLQNFHFEPVDPVVRLHVPDYIVHQDYNLDPTQVMNNLNHNVGMQPPMRYLDRLVPQGRVSVDVD